MAVKGKGKQVAGKAPASSPSSSSKRKNPISVGESSSAQPKKKRSGVLQFVDDAAKDADYEGEEEDDDLEWEDLDDFEFESPDLVGKEVKNLSKGSGKPGPIPFFIKEEEMDDVELEEAIKERYRRGSQFVSYDEDVKQCDDSELVAHAMKDLTFWRVKCMIGRERQAAFCMMQKFVDLQKIGKKLQIFSVFVLEHVKGFVYIEADKASNVFEACNGLCILYPSRIELVPSSEAPNLLSIQKKACGISKGLWVRMKSGKYKGDLAEVVFVNDVKKRVTIKLVPRIDLQAIAKKFGGGTSLKASPIPAPRLISCHELEDFRPHIEVRRDRETGEIFEVLDGLMLKDGYLYKKVSTCSLIYWGVQPSSAELMKFEDVGKDEVKDVSWLSSVYKARMKKKLPEASNQKNGDKSNPKGGDKQRSGFDLDDLVLFGKKGCGIIVDKENDSFKILKGDVNGSEVLTIHIREIKKNCVDRVFTAADRCYKTISIDDIVKVSEGPLEGREGIVRHMYKGILFIYDERQSENNGFFCAKSGLCDLVKKSRDFCGGKSGSKAGPSFAQSPIISPEQEDNSQSSGRNRQSNARGTFSVGQTLRIRKGPLKGYLCRVVRIYRADVTVKLDSLAKLLTVDEKLLSFANSKRDDFTAMQSNIFGAQEEQSIGGVLDESRGLEMDNCQLNNGMSSFGRDSWSAPSSSNFSFPLENDNQDQDQGADPWSSKLSSLNGAQEQGVANSWGKVLSPIAEQSSWNKMESGKNDGDTWSNASAKRDTASVEWKNDNPPSRETDQTLSIKGGNNGWGAAAKSATDGCSNAGGWSTAELTDPGERQTLGANSWNRPAKASTVSITETSVWEKNKPPSSDADGSWNTKGASGDWNKEASGKDKSEGFDGQLSNWESPKSGGDKQDSGDIKGKDLVKNDDSWGKFTASEEKKSVANNPWDSSSDCAVPSKAWEITSTDGKQAADWGASALSVEHGSQKSSWDKAKIAPRSTGLKKFEAGVTEAGGWKKTSDGNQAAGWAAVSMNSAAASFEAGSQTNRWDKVKTLSSTSVWEKKATDDNQAPGWGVSAMHSATPSVEHGSQTSSLGTQPGTAETGGWKNGLSNQNQIDGWNKEKSSDTDQPSSWNKAGNKDGGQDGLMGGWGKPKNFEGHSFGQEDRKEWKAGDHGQKNQHDTNFGKPTDSDWSQGSGWSQGHSRNGNGKNWEQGNCWNQQRDFDGGRGSSRGRGRGRYGGRESRNENDFEKPGDSDGGWMSGRGGGRFGSGAGGCSKGNSDDTSQFGRGRGRGRGREQGLFESSDWKSRHESADDGGFPNRPLSSWGGDEGSCWGSRINSGKISAGTIDKNSRWSSGKSFGGFSTPRVTDPLDAIGSENDMNADHASSWSKCVGTHKQAADWKKNSRNDNWNTMKSSNEELSSWNKSSLSNNAAEGDAKWNMPNTTSTYPSNWQKNETKYLSTSNSPEVSFADWVHGKSSTCDDKWATEKTGPGNDVDKKNEAAHKLGGWTSQKATTSSSHPSEDDNKWGKRKEPRDDKADDSGNWGSSKGWGDNNNSENCFSRSTAWASKKEPTSGKANWSEQEKDSFENQSSGWGNGGGNKWGKQKTSDVHEKPPWNNPSEGYKEGGQLGNWRGRSEFGRGQSSGGIGRGSSFSGTGYGRGRNSSGHNSFGWNSGDGFGKEGNDTGGSWNRGKGSFEGEKGSWNTGGQAEKVSWSSRKADGESKPAGWSEEGSGWTAASTESITESSKSGWDSAIGFCRESASVSAKDIEADNADGTGGAGGWRSTKEDGSVSRQTDDLWGSANARKGGQESSCNKEGRGWNKGSSPKASKQAHDGESAWNKANMQAGENNERNKLGRGWNSANFSKPGALDVNGSGWGSVPAAAEASKWQSGWNATTDSSRSRDAVCIGGQGGEASSQRAVAGRVSESDNLCVVDLSDTWGKAATSWGDSGKGGNAGW